MWLLLENHLLHFQCQKFLSLSIVARALAMEYLRWWAECKKERKNERKGMFMDFSFAFINLSLDLSAGFFLLVRFSSMQRSAVISIKNQFTRTTFSLPNNHLCMFTVFLLLSNFQLGAVVVFFFVSMCVFGEIFELYPYLTNNKIIE